MPKFNAYVSVYKDPAEHVEFAPGDEVPDWALDKVGDHVLEGNEVEEDDVRLRDPHYDKDSDEVQFQTTTTLPPTRPSVADNVEEDDDEDEYSAMSKAALQEEAERRGLSKSGNKEELAARLREDDEEEEE